MESIIASVLALPGYGWDGFEIIRNNRAYNSSAILLERMSGLITAFMLIIIAVSVVILSLILVMWTRDRKYEIGILMSVGIKKSAIVAQHIAENLTIAVLAFLLAWGISGFLAGQLGELLLDAVVESSEYDSGETSGAGALKDMDASPDTGAGEVIDIRVGWAELFAVAGVGFLIVVASTGVSSIAVLRMKPKNIFSSLS